MNNAYIKRVVLFAKQQVLLIVLVLVCSGFYTSAATLPFDGVVSGQISLANNSARGNYSVQVSVNRHALVVLPRPFVFIYPKVESWTQTVVIEHGRASTEFAVPVSTDASNFIAIEINCDACGPVLERQYATPQGMKEGFSTAVFYTTDNLPKQRNIRLLQDNTVSGEVVLPNEEIAPRDLILNILLKSTTNTEEVVRQVTKVIPAGHDRANFYFKKFSRFGEGLVQPVVVCINCETLYSRKTTHSSTLNTRNTHSNVEIILADYRPPPTASILLLLVD